MNNIKTYYLIPLMITAVLLADYQAFGQAPAREIKSGSEAILWANQNFAKGKVPPFSFVYGGKESNTLHHRMGIPSSETSTG